MMNEERIILEFLNNLFEKEHFSDCFVIAIAGKPSSGKWQIFVDADKGLTLNRCAEINRKIRQLIEDRQMANWGVEVSSPGLDRPLTVRRQYDKNVGRLLSVDLENDQKFKGILKAVTNDGIVIERKQKKENIEKEFSWEEIVKAKVQPQFKKK